jgi:hypothetical protein
MIIIIPESVTTVEYGAFSYLNGITELTFPGIITSASSICESCNNLKTINLPKMTREQVRNCFYLGGGAGNG